MNGLADVTGGVVHVFCDLVFFTDELADKADEAVFFMDEVVDKANDLAHDVDRLVFFGDESVNFVRKSISTVQQLRNFQPEFFRHLHHARDVLWWLPHQCAGFLEEFSSFLEVHSCKLAVKMKTHFVRNISSATAAWLVACVAGNSFAAEPTCPVVGTGQTLCYDNARVIAAPLPSQAFYGQDAQHPGHTPAYRDNGDGTVSDLVTGLMWVKARGEKMSWDAMAGAKSCRVGGHDDWRVPTIKELYSLIQFTGECSGPMAGSKPFLDTNYFGFVYGDPARGERVIDCQDWSATEYVGTTMNGNSTVFGVNFADGRIKGYPKFNPRTRSPHKLFIRYVRGNPAYGKNNFHDNGDGTITDRATGLMWSKADSDGGMNWQQALAWVQQLNATNYLGYNDWRLPNAKELQSVVDYSRIPAISPIFQISRLPNDEYPFFWTSTTHLDGPPGRAGSAAVYVCFGRALGWMQFPPGRGEFQLMDVHGAGAQRSDPKVGNPAAFPHGRGPQGDVIRIYNYVRCVRDCAK